MWTTTSPPASPRNWSLKSIRSDAPYAFSHFTSKQQRQQGMTQQEHHPPDRHNSNCSTSSSDSIPPPPSQTQPLPTQVLHGTDTPYFCGQYGHVRQQLDYAFHTHYRKERQWLHDAILEDSLLQHSHGFDEDQQHQTAYPPATASPSNSTAPWLVLLAGVHGAGKHTTIRKLVAAKQLLLRSFVCIDSDDLRRYLPEYAHYLHHYPAQVNTLTRQEAGYLAETLVLATLQARKNAIWHCSLASSQWYTQQYLPSIRRHFPGLRVALIHVTADPPTVLRRARHRAAPRPIDEAHIIKSLTQDVPVAVEAVRKAVEFTCTVRNNQGSQLELLEEGMSWQTFRETFRQWTDDEDSDHGTSMGLIDKAMATISVDNDNLHVLESGLVPRSRNLPCADMVSTQSTEENHRASHSEFYGQFAHIRATLDYEYHSNYTFARQLLQDSIVRSFLEAAIVKDSRGRVCSTPTRPWIVFTAGAMGAGKGFTVSQLVKDGHFPLLAFVRVNTDAIRRKLPEYEMYIRHCTQKAGELTHKEAGYIAELLTLASLQGGKNVIVDGSLRRTSWYRTLFSRLRREFDGLRIAILHVSATREAVLARAEARAKETGRIVPRETLIQALEQVPKSVEELAPLVDYHVELLNSSDREHVQLVTPGETWESFRSHWEQNLAWVANNSQPKLLEKSKEIERHMVDALET